MRQIPGPFRNRFGQLDGDGGWRTDTDPVASDDGSGQSAGGYIPYRKVIRHVYNFVELFLKIQKKHAEILRIDDPSFHTSFTRTFLPKLQVMFDKFQWLRCECEEEIQKGRGR